MERPTFKPSDDIGTIKKQFQPPNSYEWPLGFYINICLKFIILHILFLDDYIHSRSIKYIKQLEYMKNVKIEPSLVVKTYMFLIIFLLMQWISTLNLNTWGFLFSNIVSILYFLALFINKHKINFF